MKNHVENSKKFELDKLLIKKIYNIPDKKKPEYKVIKKNVVYDKQLTRQYFTYSNINKDNYFCNYQSFRDYLSSGYDYYFLVNELSNIRSILDISHNIREIVNKKLNPNKAQKKHLYNQAQGKLDEMNNSISNQLIQKLNSNNRRPSTVFQLDKDNPLVKRMSNMTHKNSNTNQNTQKLNNFNPRLNEEEIHDNKFIEKCHLLKKKEEEENLPKNQYHFRLYSMLSEEFDKLKLPVYEDFINVKYENQKNSLIEIYNKERAFTNRAIQMKERMKLLAKESKMKLKQNQENISESIDINNSRQNINPLPDMNLRDIPQDTYETKVPYITSFFFGRSELYFKEIDNFMNMYKEKTSLASKQLEKDFFENLYKILTFNNADCKKFFHYLYSNSYFFKYIYNIFTTNNKSDDSLKNIAPSIKRHNDDEPFLNESQKESFFPGAREKIIDENKYIIVQKKPDENNEQEEDLKKKEIDEFFDSLVGNDFIYQISLIQEDVSELVDKKKIKKFKKILTSNDRYEDNFIITLNNEDNMLQIYNTKENQYLFSFYFDENISFYDLDKDINNNLKSDKIQPNQKYILIIQKNNFSNYNNSYVFKLNQDIYTRFIKSIQSKGNKIKKIELFSSEEKEESNNVNININEKDNSEEKKLKLEDILSLQGNNAKNQNESQESEKHSSSKNDNNIKFDQRNPSRSISFRKNSVNKSNSGNEKSENEEKEKKKKKELNNDINKEEKEEDENEEEEDDEENEDNEEDEDNEDNDEEKEKEKNVSNKIKKLNLNKEKSEEEENSEKDNINNKLSEEKKSEGSDNNNNNKKKLNLNLNNKKLKNLGEEIDDPVFGNNQTIESQPKSLENEE